MKNGAKLILTLACLGGVIALAQNNRPGGRNRQVGRFRNRVSITVRGPYRYISCNGIPDHRTGPFPNAHNPNSIREQHYEFRVPAHPRQSEQPRAFGLGKFGVAVNGVPFDPGAAEFWNGNPRSGWQFEAMRGRIDLGLDQNNAHVQPNGAYHYHGIPVGLMKNLTDGENQMTLIGWAGDGFPIYGPLGYRKADDSASGVRIMKSSYRVKRGTRPTEPGGLYDGTFTNDFEYVAGSGDLDECNGRVGVTPEFPEGTYHYYVTDSFPYIPRQFKGTPDASFTRRGPGPGGPRGGRMRGRPPFPPPGGGFGPPPDGGPPGDFRDRPQGGADRGSAFGPRPDGGPPDRN